MTRSPWWTWWISGMAIGWIAGAISSRVSPDSDQTDGRDDA